MNTNTALLEKTINTQPKLETLPLIKKQQKQKYFFSGAFLGAVAFLLIYGFAPLNVTFDAWLQTGFIEKDILQHYAGWLFFRESPFAFPLGFTQSINYPTGLAISFTDSIPLFAIFFRMFENILPETFQYFGIFGFLCLILQGGAASLLLSLFEKRLAPVLCGTGLFISAPILLERMFRHTALGAHCLLIFALYLYFQNKKEGFKFRFGYIIILAITPAIHPYFIPMVCAILFADLLEYAFATKNWVKAVAFLSVNLFAVLVTGFCIGMFSSSASSGSGTGYGFFNMNLNALFNPGGAAGLDWSLFLPKSEYALGTVEGFNYIGIAMLICAPVFIVYLLLHTKKDVILSYAKRYIGLIFVSLCLTVFALSTTWVFGANTLFSITLPASIQGLLNTFRSSGRMFWVVYYLIILFVCISIFRLLKGNKAIVCMALVLCLQLIDISPYLVNASSFFVEPQKPAEYYLNDNYWHEISTHYENLYAIGDAPIEPLALAQYAGKSSMTTNHVWAARIDETAQARIDIETQNLLGGIVQENNLYVTSNRELFLNVAGATQENAWSVQIDEVWYLIIPKKYGVPAPVASEKMLVYPNIPFKLANLTDAAWTDGVLNTDKTIVTFANNEYTQKYLKDATAIICEGIEYEILNKDYGDAGWVMVTLNIENADVLVDKELTTK